MSRNFLLSSLWCDGTLFPRRISRIGRFFQFSLNSVFRSRFVSIIFSAAIHQTWSVVLLGIHNEVFSGNFQRIIKEQFWSRIDGSPINYAIRHANVDGSMSKWTAKNNFPRFLLSCCCNSISIGQHWKMLDSSSWHKMQSWLY